MNHNNIEITGVDITGARNEKKMSATENENVTENIESDTSGVQTENDAENNTEQKNDDMMVASDDYIMISTKRSI